METQKASKKEESEEKQSVDGSSNSKQKETDVFKEEKPNTLSIDAKDDEKVEEPEIDYRPPEYVQYFETKSKNIDRTADLLSHCFENLKSEIKQGRSIINDEAKDLTHYIRESSPVREKSQQKQDGKQRLIELPPEPPEHKSFIERMNKVRKQSEIRRKLNMEYDQKKKEKMVQKLEEQRVKQEQTKREEREKQFKEKMSELEQRKQKNREEQLQSLKRYRSVISQKRRHELMTEKYETSVVLPLLQEQKKKLSERSQKIKGYSIDEIRSFEKEYLRREQERMQSEPRHQKDDWKYVPPAINPRLHQIIQQQKIKQRIKMEQKKRALEQKISRQQNYVQYLRENLSVKIDEKKKKELEDLNAPRPQLQKSHEETKNIGNNYLKQARLKAKRDKKDSYSTHAEPSKEISVSESKLKANTSMGHYSHPETSHKIHQSRISKIISSDCIEKSQKVTKLQQEIQKLNEQARRKDELSKGKPKRKDSDSLQILLNSIKAKVGIMNLYKD